MKQQLQQQRQLNKIKSFFFSSFISFHCCAFSMSSSMRCFRSLMKCFFIERELQSFLIRNVLHIIMRYSHNKLFAISYNLHFFRQHRALEVDWFLTMTFNANISSDIMMMVHEKTLNRILSDFLACAFVCAIYWAIIF